MLNEILLKDNLRKELLKTLDHNSVSKALSNNLTRRKPRPCGFTIHTGIGCSFQCTYCYIGDMGFPWKISKYPLNGLETIYALLSNPYFIPGEEGSLIAIGSVTEPFHPLTTSSTLDYIDKITKYLKNPIQFSTKTYLSENVVRELAGINQKISPLITIVTLRKHNLLEPYTPPPDKRFETIRLLRKSGFKPFLFLRPIIPGLIEDEYVDVIDKSIEHGAVGIVVGSLRVTNNIIERLKEKGIDTSELMKRLPRKPRGREQVSIDTSDLKNMIIKYARKNKLIALPEACMANLYTHGYTCWKMIYLGYSTSYKPKFPSREDIYRLASEIGVNLEDVKLSKYGVILWISYGLDKSTLLSEIIHSRYKLCVSIRKI